MTTDASTTTASNIAAEALKVAGAEPAADPSKDAPVTVNTSFAEEDARLAELLKLEAEEKAALEAEAKGTAAPAGEAAGAPGSAGAPAAVPAGTAASAAAAPAAGMTAAQAASKDGAIIALRKRLQETDAARLVAEGQVKALEPLARGRMAEPGQDGESATPAADQPSETDLAITALDGQILELAAEFEAGTITATEWKKQEIALSKQQRQLANQQQAEIVEATATRIAEETASKRTNDLGLLEHADRLANDFTVLKRLTPEQLAPFESVAYAEAFMEGVTIPANAVGDKMLRERMAALAERKYDPERAAQRARDKAVSDAAIVGQTPGAPGAPAGPTAAQREAKLTLAASLPPDIGKIGSGAQGGEMSEAAIEAALSGNDDERIRFLDANPGLVAKIMGGPKQRAAR